MLDVRQNRIESLEPLAKLRELNFLLLTGNQVSDLGPLVAMCRADAEGEKRFAPYLKLYIGENPATVDGGNAEQLDELRKLGVRVFVE
jgi:Leucine-rich repeat (LRR) protein